MRRLAYVLALLAPAVLAQGDAVSPYVAGVAALDVADYEEAARQLQAAVHADPRDAEAHYALAQVHAAASPLRDERAVLRHLDRALRLDPDNARFLEARLDALRRTSSEETAFSMTDTRRPALARRILDIDSTNALAHEELALSAFLEFDWRRQLAGRAGGWDPEAEDGRSGAANRARLRTLAHLDAALHSEPARESAHRLRLRLFAGMRDDAGLAQAAQAFAEACPDDPDADLYLGLAAYRQGDLGAAQARFDAALSALPSDERTAFDDLALFLQDDEADAYAADSSGFAERFWAARDPRLLSTENERRLDHYARLALADLLFADVRRGTRGWATPRGEVVVRYGLPDREARQLASNVIARDFGAYEGWEYEGEDGFALRFVDAFRAGDYDFPSSAFGEDDATRARSLFHRMPERFRYAPPRGFTPFPHLVAAFRGAKGRTDLVVPLAIPLAAGVEPNDDALLLGIDSGVFVLDADGLPVAEAQHRTSRLTPGAAVRSGEATELLDGFTVPVRPGDYTLAVEFEQRRTGAVGVKREALTVRDFAGPGLRVSDLLPALLVEETDGPVGAGWLRRGDFAIQAAPWGAFAADAPIYLYVEIYGLGRRDGRTDYEVEARLQPEDRAGAFERAARLLFGRRAPTGVGAGFSASGVRADEGQYLILDASGQEPGAYVLTLAVHDRATGMRAETSRRLTLREPEPPASHRR